MKQNGSKCNSNGRGASSISEHAALRKVRCELCGKRFRALLDAEHHAVVLYLKVGLCAADMQPAITYAKTLDHEAREVQIMYGKKPGVRYALINGEWVCLRGGR